MGKFLENNEFGKGRPKGSQNKATESARQQMSDILALSLAEIAKRLSQMKDGDLIEATSLMAKHTVPIPKETNEDGSSDNVIIITGNLLK